MVPRVAAFRLGLDEIGYVEGRNLTIDWRSTERQPNRLRAWAADLVARRVAAIVTVGDPATIAAKAATSTIPIVFLSAADPVKSGLAAGLDRPDGNVTGLSWFGADLAPARLSLLHQLVPKPAVIGLLVDSNLADATTRLPEVQAAADAAGSSSSCCIPAAQATSMPHLPRWLRSGSAPSRSARAPSSPASASS